MKEYHFRLIQHINETGIIARVPYGVTVGLLAWNFPLAFVARKAGNALATGNTMVIKPPTEIPLTVMYFGELVAKRWLCSCVARTRTWSSCE